MILDAQNEFSDGQAVTASAISNNVIDAKGYGPTHNVGGLETLFLVIQADATATAAGAATVTFELISDSVATLDSSPTVHSSTGAVGKATMAAGTTLAVMPLPFGEYERYIGVRYTVGTGPLTAGAFSAFLTRDPERWTPQPANNPPAH